MNTYTIETVSAADHNQIIAVWEASVRATHDFLLESDLLIYKELLDTKYLPATSLYCIKLDGKITGFIGAADKSIDMLFAHPSQFGRGIGRALAEYAIKELGCNTVEVNEQNTRALQFYLKLGFIITGRSNTDGFDKPYPLLYMQLQ